MTSLTVLAIAAMFATPFAADHHGEKKHSEFVTACKAYQAENADARSDCECLGKKVEEDAQVGVDLAAIAEGNPPTEKATAAIAACPGKSAE